MLLKTLLVMGAVFAIPTFSYGQAETGRFDDKSAPRDRRSTPFVFVEVETQETLRLAKLSRETAAELIKSSRSAFLRGLISVDDYAERLADARRLQIAALARSNNKAGLEVLQQHRSHWAEAVKHLQGLRQPASAGWAADLAYARMMESAVGSRAAEQANRSDLARSLNEQRVALAQQQFRLRFADFEFGLASLTQMSESLSQLRQTVVAANLAGVANRSLRDAGLQRDAKRVEERVALLQERPAGISRPDALQRVAYELDIVAADNTSRDVDVADKTGRLKDADAAAGKMLSVQHRAFSRGTASLGDLIRSWRLQRYALESMQRIEKPGEPVRPEQRTQQELRRLQTIADAVVDRRGRNAADIAYVSCLVSQQEWRSLRAQQWAVQKQAYKERQ